MSSPADLGLQWIRKPKTATCVIFVHGILSGGEKCWRHDPQTSWPQLLADDDKLKDIGVGVFSYRTDVNSRTYSVGDVVDSLREALDLSEVEQVNRLIFVCHSLGGIVVRRFIVVEQAKFIARKIEIGLFLVASPSIGSKDANDLFLLSAIAGNSQAQALRFSQKNEWLNDLDKEFINLLGGGKLSIKGKELVEDQAIKLKKWFGLNRQIVEPVAAARYFAESYKVPYSDHSTIVKPKDKDAMQHRVLCRFIENMIRPRPQSYLANVNPYDTGHAKELLEQLENKLNAEDAQKHRDALVSVNEALLETRRYLTYRREGGERNGEKEEQLSNLWRDAGTSIQSYDSDLARLCWVKGHGWADETVWEDPRYKNLPIRLNDMLDRLLYSQESVGKKKAAAIAS
jgi:hypothetical protein